MANYVIFDNNNEIILSTNDKNDCNIFLMTNSSGSIYMFHKEYDRFIMYFENYTLNMKMS